MKRNKTILVIAAHPDDEILGCGATMAKHASQGDEVITVIAAEGITSRDVRRNVDANQKKLSELESVCRQANHSIGAAEVIFLGLPDNRMDALELLDVVKTLEAVIEKQ